MSDSQKQYISNTASASRVGGRHENQDNYGSTTTPFGQLFVVCDGMGGGPGGCTASTMAVNVFIQSVVDADSNMSCQEIMTHSAVVANDTLIQLMSQSPELQGMGTTLVAVLLTDEAAVIAHVGDSRLYQMHGKKVIFRTADHSLVADMVRHGTLSEEQARLSSQSNIITRALGAGNAHTAEIDTVPYSQGDRFILCTDGVWGSMPEPDLTALFCGKQPLPELVDGIATCVDNIGIEKGGRHDNLTLTVIDVYTNSLMRPEHSGKMSRIKNAIKKIF